MSSPTGVEVVEHSCECPMRSRAFPPVLSCLLDTENQDQASLHWEDGTGWVPCVREESSYLVLQHLAIELGLEHTPFDEYRAGCVAAAAELNRLPLEHWQGKYRAELSRLLFHRERLVRKAEYRVTAAQAEARKAECRLAVADLYDPRLAEMAHRMLDEGWAGSPSDLVACARGVLQ